MNDKFFDTLVLKLVPLQQSISYTIFILYFKLQKILVLMFIEIFSPYVAQFGRVQCGMLGGF